MKKYIITFFLSFYFLNANAYLAPWCKAEADSAVNFAKKKSSGQTRKQIIVEMMAFYKDPNFDKRSLSIDQIDDLIDSHVETINWIFSKENVSLKNDDLWLKKFDECMVLIKKIQKEVEKIIFIKECFIKKY